MGTKLGKIYIFFVLILKSFYLHIVMIKTEGGCIIFWLPFWGIQGCCRQIAQCPCLSTDKDNKHQRSKP